MRGLKIKTQHKAKIHPADWIAGVEYEDEDEEANDDEYKDDDNENYEYDDELDEEDYYDRVDPDKLEDLRAETSEQRDVNDANPNGEDEQQAPNETERNDSETASLVTESSETLRRSERNTNRPVKYSQYQTTEPKRKVKFPDSDQFELENCHNLMVDARNGNNRMIEYDLEGAMIAAEWIVEINNKATVQGASFAQQYMLKRGIKKYGERGSEAAMKELDQLHQRNCFTPIDINKLTPSEKRKAQEALMFLTKKHDGKIKGRMVYNGKPTREWLSREDAASPTVSLESILLTAVVDAHEGRDVMSADVPNAFVQTQMPKPKKEKNE
jgi:hypothetical protein